MIKLLRAQFILPQVRRRENYYIRCGFYEERLAEQLRLFNQCWFKIRSTVPFYRDLACAKKLPEAFRSWEEIVEVFPVIDRTTIQQHRERLTDQTRLPQWYRITGGSTAQPIQLPAWKSENTYLAPDIWLGRSWYGIQPTDRQFMIWGHSHLLGTGWRGRYNQYLRELKDRLLGYYRFSAYNMNTASMRSAVESLLNFHPDYMIGYSVALDAFARSNEDRAEALRALGLKAIIGAAEGFPADDSVELIARILGAPVALEYGSVETNLIAHTHPTGGYRVFWRTYFVEAVENSTNGKTIRVTSLYPRCFPLIRYEIGDEIEPYPDEPVLGVNCFERVIGRCNDYLLLRDGSRIHSELVTHAVRSCSQITGYQAVQTGTDIRLKFLSSTEIPIDVIRGIQYRLGKIHPDLASVPIERVFSLNQTIAGKTPIVIRQPKNEKINSYAIKH